MAPEQESKSENVSAERPRAAGPPRRGRRGGRGRRSGVRRPAAAPAPGRPEASEPLADDPAMEAAAPTSESRPDEIEQERAPEQERPRASRPPARELRRAAPASVQDAVIEVQRIVEMLSESLEDMESVQHTLELAERQKSADEREIDSLRRALSQIRRPRESEHHSPRPPADRDADPDQS